jgi:hypothetical protein
MELCQRRREPLNGCVCLTPPLIEKCADTYWYLANRFAEI